LVFLGTGVEELGDLQQRKHRAYTLYQGIPDTLIVHKKQGSTPDQSFSKNNACKKNCKGSRQGDYLVTPQAMPCAFGLKVPTMASVQAHRCLICSG